MASLSSRIPPSTELSASKFCGGTLRRLSSRAAMKRSIDAVKSRRIDQLKKCFCSGECKVKKTKCKKILGHWPKLFCRCCRRRPRCTISYPAFCQVTWRDRRVSPQLVNNLLTITAQVKNFGRRAEIQTAMSLTLMKDRAHRRMNAAAHVEVTDHRQFAWLAGGNKIVENLVDHRFMERAFVAIGPEVEFQRFELDVEFVGHIVDLDGSEIRLAGSRADAGEFRTFHGDLVVAFRTRIGKSFQFFAWSGRHDAILAHAHMISNRGHFLTHPRDG